MDGFTKLLEKELEAEIDYILDNKFVTYAAKQNKYLYKEGLREELSRKEINLKRIKQYTGIDLYGTNEAYQLFILTDPFNIKKGTYERTKLVKNTVLMKYFFNSKDAKKKEAAMDILMALHCGNYKSLEFSPGIDTLNMLRDFDTKLLSKEFSFDHTIAIKFLVYYNSQKNKLLNEEYKKLLGEYAKKMQEYLEFCGLENIDLDNVDLNMNYRADNSNYKLLSFFYDKSIPVTRNKYYDLENIKELLSKGDNKKEMLITSLCMFDVNDELVSRFKGVELQYDDLIEYISKYEASGNILNATQFEKLLLNFRKYHFYSNGLGAEYDKDIAYVRKCYEEYCFDDYEHNYLKFIKHFNEDKKYRLSYFSSIENEPLNKSMFDEIIHNIPSGYSYFANTKSGANYRMLLEIGEKHDSSDRKYIKDKYYSLLDGYMTVKGITFDYFLKKYIPECDRDGVIDLANWYATKNNITFESNDDAKIITARLLYRDLENEILNCSFKDRYKISDKYRAIIEENDLEEYLPMGLQYFLRTLTSKKLDSILPNFIHDFNESVKNGNNPYLVVEKFGLKNIDAKSLLQKTYGKGKEYQDRVKLMQAGAEKCRAERYEAKKEAKVQRKEEILKGYATSELGLRDYAKVFGLSVKELLTWMNDNDYQPGIEKYQAEIEDTAYCLDNLDAIIFGINHGVESANGIRNFTLFDLLMLQDEVIPFERIEMALTNPIVRFSPGYSIVNTKKFIGRTKGTSRSILHMENYDDAVGASREVNTVMNLNIIIPTEDGMKTITDEEKKYVLDFIDEMGYPRKVFLDALLAHANGDYDFEAKRKTVVKKKENN